MYFLFVVLLTVVLFQSHNKDLDKNKASQNCLERGMEQVTQRLEVAQEEIQRLTDKLQLKEMEESKLGKLRLQMIMAGRVLIAVMFYQEDHKHTEENKF